VARMVVDVMARTVRLRVPLVVDAKAGRDWYEMTPLAPGAAVAGGGAAGAPHA